MTKVDMINYTRLGLAQTFYKALGYLNINTPWMVTPHAVTATLPPDSRLIQSNFGCLVGSGEQGFIQMMLDGVLEPGKYQTTTPCFRDEANQDDLTLPYFMKTELIWYMPEGELQIAYQTVLNNALACFFDISDADEFDAVQTAEGFDLMFAGIELGSYGVRRMGDHVWVYGTGLAEPRFSQVVQKRLVSAPLLPAEDTTPQTSDPAPSTPDAPIGFQPEEFLTGE